MNNCEIYTVHDMPAWFWRIYSPFCLIGVVYCIWCTDAYLHTWTKNNHAEGVVGDWAVCGSQVILFRYIFWAYSSYSLELDFYLGFVLFYLTLESLLRLWCYLFKYLCLALDLDLQMYDILRTIIARFIQKCITFTRLINEYTLLFDSV